MLGRLAAEEDDEPDAVGGTGMGASYGLGPRERVGGGADAAHAATSAARRRWPCAGPR